VFEIEHTLLDSIDLRPQWTVPDEMVARLSGQESSMLTTRSGVDERPPALAAARSYLEPENSVDRVVIITYPRDVYFWTRSIEHDAQLGPAFTPVGSVGERLRSYSATPARWVVIPNSLLLNDLEAILPLMPSSLLIMDHPWINPNTKRSRALLRLSQEAKNRMTLHLYPRIHVLLPALDPWDTNAAARQALCTQAQLAGDTRTSVQTITQGP
jgi:hypothetical protein